MTTELLKPKRETGERTRPARLIKCHAHFTDTDRQGNCGYCGGAPGSSPVRNTNEHDG